LPQRTPPHIQFHQITSITMLLAPRANYPGHDNMSYSTTSTPMLSPHGVIGEHIQAQPRSQCQSPAYRHTLDLSGLTLTTRDDISVQSHRDREREIDIFQRGPFDPISKWCNNPNDLKPNDDGWERASANRFASRPPSPKKGEVFYDNYNEHPKTALPTFPAFNPIITPPPPHALLLPSHSNSPSPAHSERGRHVANQAGQHLSGLQGLMGPLVSQVDELERLQQELAHWKTSCEVANAELLQIKAVVAQPAVSCFVDLHLDINQKLIARYKLDQLTPQ